MFGALQGGDRVSAALQVSDVEVRKAKLAGISGPKPQILRIGSLAETARGSHRATPATEQRHNATERVTRSCPTAGTAP